MPDDRERERTVMRRAIVDPHRALADFEGLRSRLFGIAYQMLRRAADAEDVVQDVWIRWQGADHAQVRDPVAFLVATTTRTAINAATSAYARREVSARWFPEPPLMSADLALEAERGEALEDAVMLLMRRLSPVERAVYVLREGFEYPMCEIAKALGLSEANTRQLAHRARKHLTERRYNQVDPMERDELLEALRDAARLGDMIGLINLLSRCIRQFRGPTAAASGRVRSVEPAADTRPGQRP